MRETSGPLEVGYGQAEITPPAGTPLSGFIARENRPSVGVESPLYVRVLALRSGQHVFLLLSYDLLGLGAELEARLQTQLRQALPSNLTQERCILTAVHNHSGPPTGLLLGEAAPPPGYLEHVASQSVVAAGQAFKALCLAKLYTAELSLPGLTYNRRALLSDGRVSIMPVPDRPVVRRGPLDNRLTLLVWRDMAGRNIAGLIHYACHGVAVLSQAVGGDIPGALVAKIGEKLDAPCLFLQGAAGDVNPTTVTAGSAELSAWIDQALSQLHDLENRFQPVSAQPVRAAARSLLLNFAPLPTLEAAERNLADLLRIAAGDTTSADLQAALRSFKNTLNVPPETTLEPAQTRHVALALAEHARRVLAAAQSGRPLHPLALWLGAWQVGQFLLIFVAAELFTATGLKIRALNPARTILPISYLAPLVGYLPDQEAIALGGYEVDDAWRFYGHPAAFAAESEARLIAEVDALMQSLAG
jgi:hypothetical protein